ncbi:protein of unknown function [Agreia sp. COWG]|nr:protein of unknown function [Agreia sp. COWG]
MGHHYVPSKKNYVTFRFIANQKYADFDLAYV